jgi:uncharacterized protein YxeA
MKRLLAILLALVLILTFGAFALGSGESGTDNQNKEDSSAAAKDENKNNLGDYNIEIKSSRLTTDYAGKPVIVITYSYTNNSDDPTAFYIAVEDLAFQNDIGLNETFMVKDGDPYNADNQRKEIKKGATLDVEVAYDLNDTTTPVEVEVTELISLNDYKVTKTFEIA